MAKKEERKLSWHERAIYEKAHRDARADRYDPPPGWLSRNWIVGSASDKDAYDAGWQRGKAATPFRLDLRGAFLRRTDLTEANLRGADLAGADFTNAIFRGADFENAVLDGTILKGADLTGAKHLTLTQLRKAMVDETTMLPEGVSIDDVVAKRQPIAS
jgi:hypothetical protein